MFYDKCICNIVSVLEVNFYFFPPKHTKPHVQIQRTNSAPVRPNPLPTSMFGKNTEGMYMRFYFANTFFSGY